MVAFVAWSLMEHFNFSLSFRRFATLANPLLRQRTQQDLFVIDQSLPPPISWFLGHFERWPIHWKASQFNQGKKSVGLFYYFPRPRIEVSDGAWRVLPFYCVNSGCRFLSLSSNFEASCVIFPQITRAMGARRLLRRESPVNEKYRGRDDKIVCVVVFSEGCSYNLAKEKYSDWL